MDLSQKVGLFHGNIKLETCSDLDKGISRPRVRAIDTFPETTRVEFPRKLRELFPIGTQFIATVKICQKHNRDGTEKGGPYLKAYDIAIVSSSIKQEGLIAKVKDGSISGIAYEYEFKKNC